MSIIGTAQIKVYNVAEYAGDDHFWVVRIYDGEAWFFGSYDNPFKAEQVAHEIGGIVVENKEVQ